MLRSDEPDNMHREHSYNIILKHREELDNVCNCSVAEKASVIARLHGRSDPVPQDINNELKLCSVSNTSTKHILLPNLDSFRY